MTEPMTLEEAVRVWRLSRDKQLTVNLGAVIEAFAALAAALSQETT